MRATPFSLAHGLKVVLLTEVEIPSISFVLEANIEDF